MSKVISVFYLLRHQLIHLAAFIRFTFTLERAMKAQRGE